MLNKPSKCKRAYYDYHECRDYLQEKYGYDERDYAGKFKKPLSKDYDKIPYQDFWHWVCDNHDLHNGCYIIFSREQLEDEYNEMEDWQKEIYKRYLDEFADKNGEVEFYVWW